MEEFLFASGNMKYWLVVSREELLGEDGGKRYNGKPITVTASSERCLSYQGDRLGLSQGLDMSVFYSKDVQQRTLCGRSLG